MNRLPQTPMEKIDRQIRLGFTWQKKKYFGLQGDSIATALHANGLGTISRSLKYHRPRGLYSLDGESANTLVNVDGECNVRAEQTLLREGMQVTAQNYLFHLEYDPLELLDFLDYFMPAGFYYRRFHKPPFIWPLSLKLIRRLAGTGIIDPQKQYDPHLFPELYPKADVCVIGGGPAGLTAALNAAEQGLRVTLFEARPHLGGFYDWRSCRDSSGTPLYERGRKLASQAMAHENIRVFTHTFVTNVNGDNLVTAFRVGGADDSFQQQYIQVRPAGLVVASGCIERPLIFEHNERPGVRQVNCAVRLARTYALAPGRNAVLSVGDDLGLEAALDLNDLGINILAVADARISGHDARLVEALVDKGLNFLPGWTASRALGRKRVRGVELRNTTSLTAKTYGCDLLIASAGLTPAAGPLAAAGAKFSYDRQTGFYLPSELPPRLHPAGRVLGYTDPEAIEASGALAGLKAAADIKNGIDPAPAQNALDSLPGPARGSTLAHAPLTGTGKKSFICFDEDGTYKTLKQSIEQGFDVPELAKRFGGFGLGPGQGGVPGHNLPLVTAEIKGQDPSQYLPTTNRAPIVPVLMATLAGPGHDVFKRTAMHQDQEAAGAVFRRVGVWKRARYFSQDFSPDLEVEAVRNNVGLIDVSTLGKFRIHGPDALKALQRCYISNMSRTRAGKLKYSAILNDDGMILDDGVVTKINDQDYYFTTSTGRAGITAEWFRYHTRYEEWDYHLVNLTDTLAAINLAGPLAREVLLKLTTSEVSDQALPFMGYKEIKLSGEIPARVLRLGFVGERSYELHFPASYGSAVWNLLLEAGREYGIRPFGLEAQFILRLEKGHIIIGQETEQRVNLLDLGLGFLWDRKDLSSKKTGAPALTFTEDQPDRFKLAGFRLNDPGRLPGDGSIIHDQDEIVGHVCSCRRSRTLGQTIGLALVRQRFASVSSQLNIYQNDRNQPLNYTAEVVKTPFYDPQGERMKG